MACGVLKQVAEHFRKVSSVERHLHVVGNVRFECHAHARRACQIKAVIGLLHAAALTALVRGSHTCSVSMERKAVPERY